MLQEKMCIRDRGILVTALTLTKSLYSRTKNTNFLEVLLYTSAQVNSSTRVLSQLKYQTENRAANLRCFSQKYRNRFRLHKRVYPAKLMYNEIILNRNNLSIF